VLPAPAQQPGRGLLRTAPVHAQQPERRSDQTVQVDDVTDRRPRVDLLDEQGLGLVHVADAGEVALIHER
jgi:hypothetical protein